MSWLHKLNESPNHMLQRLSYRARSDVTKDGRFSRSGVFVQDLCVFRFLSVISEIALCPSFDSGFK
jgi:hypothetical protein